MAILRGLLAIQLLFAMSFAFADDSPGMLQSSGNLADSTAQGAIDNHNNAENTGQMAHQHHHMAHSGGGAAMMAKALGEAQQAMQLQNQAQQMARASLDSMKSASQQVDQSANGYSAQDVALLNQIATQQSDLMTQLQSEFAADGYNISSTAGTLAAPSDTSALTAGQGGTSTSTTTVLRSPSSSGTNTVYVPQGAVGAAGGGASGQAVDPTTAAKNGLQAGAGGKGADGTPLSGAVAPAPGTSEGIVSDQRKLLALHRAQVLGQLGQSGLAGSDGLDENGQPIPKSPIRSKAENIFEVVHTHYQSLRGGGRFFEASLPAEDSKTRASLPEFQKGF